MLACGNRNRGFLRLEVQPVGVALLLGDPALLDQLAVAVPGNLSEIPVGLCLLQRGLHLRESSLGLRNLMLDFRGRYLDQQIPGLDLAADVDGTLGDITARAGIDVSLLECFGSAGPAHRHRTAARPHRRGPHARDEVAALLGGRHHLRVQPVVLPETDA